MGNSVVTGRMLVAGSGSGAVVSTSVPLSFWGGFNPHTGDIVDHHHPLFGQNIAGKILVMPTGRGSCTASGVLLEAIRTGNAPSAIILAQADTIIALGSIVADEMFGHHVPIVVLDPTSFTMAQNASYAVIRDDGQVTLEGVIH